MPTPVEEVCDTLLDTVVALAATGRRHLTPHQANALARAASPTACATPAVRDEVVARAEDWVRCGWPDARARVVIDG
nr:hypothetical protein [Cellulosimicrobium sp. MM]